jgi:hypothetical protein
MDPALDPARDLEKADYCSSQAFPHESSDLLPGSSWMIYYEISGPGNTLRLSKEDDKIVIRY